MRKLNERHGFPAVDRALRFTLQRVKARPETKDLEEPITQTRAELRTLHDAWQEAVDVRVAQNAEVEYRDGRLDRVVLGPLREDVQTLAESQRNGAALIRGLYQGTAPSTAMKPIATESQTAFVGKLVERIESDAACEPLREHAGQLRARQGDIDEAVRARTGTLSAEQAARARLDAAIERARATYNLLYPRVQLAFPNDPALVESYFLDPRPAGSGLDGNTPPPSGRPPCACQAEPRRV